MFKKILIPNFIWYLPKFKDAIIQIIHHVPCPCQLRCYPLLRRQLISSSRSTPSLLICSLHKTAEILAIWSITVDMRAYLFHMAPTKPGAGAWSAKDSRLAVAVASVLLRFWSINPPNLEPDDFCLIVSKWNLVECSTYSSGLCSHTIRWRRGRSCSTFHCWLLAVGWHVVDLDL